MGKITEWKPLEPIEDAPGCLDGMPKTFHRCDDCGLNYQIPYGLYQPLECPLCKLRTAIRNLRLGDR